MSMFYAAIVMTSISAHFAVESSKAQAKATKKAAYFNAVEDRKEAAQAMDIAAENARRKERENQRILASLRAENANSGFQMSGSPLAVFGDTAFQLERDILDISFQAESQARALQSRAAMGMWEGEQRAAGIINQGTASAIGSVAGGVTGAFQSSGYLGG